MSDTADRKIGLERFLQLEEQRSGVAAILRRSYAQKAMTISEWEETVSSILKKKAK